MLILNFNHSTHNYTV